MFNSQTQDGYSISVPMEFHHYKIVEYIGCGCTCIVVLVIDTNTDAEYAAKIISIQNVEDKKITKSTQQEVKVLKKLDHPNIIKIHETFELKTNDDNYYVIIMDYCNNGDLLTYALKKLFSSEIEKKKIIYGLLDAIRYLHSKGISHGDIKSENVLLDSNYSPKLCDFGFCRTTKYAGNESKNGTLYYAAPELFTKGKFDTKKADIWAVGIMIYSLFELQFPFKDGKQSFIIKQIMSGNLLINKSLDPRIRKIVEQCTNVDPNKRPTIDEILQSDYFNEIHNQQLIESKDNNSTEFKNIQNLMPKMLSYSSGDEPEAVETVF